MKKLATLFLTFLKIGAFTFGGGYAMIALLENECIDKHHWLNREEFLDMVAIAESTPGPTAINGATYLGYKVAGVAGAAAATLAVTLPAFVIMYVISLFLDRFLSLTLVACAFKGVQVGVVYLILSAGGHMLKGLPKTALNIGIVVAVSVAMVAFSLLAVSFSAVYYILICGALGLLVYAVNRMRGEGSK